MLAISSAIGCGFPLEEALRRAAATGLKNLDLLTIQGWAHVNPGDLADRWEATVQDLESRLGNHGLRIVSLNAMLGPKMHDRSEEAGARRAVEMAAIFRLLKRFGIKTIAWQPPLKWQEAWTDAEQDLCLATLREQLDLAKREGITLALELHTRSPFETLAQVKRLLASIPDVPLVYDATHFVLQNTPIRETEWMLANARHVHLRDAAPGQIQTALGQGTVDFDWVLGALRERRYNGVISIEYLGSKETAFDTLESARGLAGRIGERWPEIL